MADNKYTNEWYVIINPFSGTTKSRTELLRISRLIGDAGLNASIKFTQYKGHAIDITTQCIAKGYRKIIVAGGDGTINEVVNGIFKQNHTPSYEITLGLIPIGSGNDLCRMYDIPENVYFAIEIIKRNKTYLQDVGWVAYSNDGIREGKFFVNIAGMGFDAFVAQRTNVWKEKLMKGKLLYILSLISSLASYRAKKIKVSCNNKVIFNDYTFSMAVGIGKYNGGGMMQLPNSINNDGLFDVSIIGKMRKPEVIKNIKNLYDGSYINNPKVKLFKEESLLVECEKKLLLEADGESLGTSPFEFDILPKSLKVITGV